MTIQSFSSTAAVADGMGLSDIENQIIPDKKDQSNKKEETHSGIVSATSLDMKTQSNDVLNEN